ncbi:hypothetical protein FGO68_gene4792 [Halteria grandinella]|uniref:Peptidase M1 membrane alanine aminopeptidase domain-containing protein n=1 Tax=Halteria grandinella TaxID=5974 RepID=A0A8J8NFK7_HALGN|nr:hypothetical protein FGO68_gene4792 [Halteria grandinella]
MQTISGHQPAEFVKEQFRNVEGLYQFWVFKDTKPLPTYQFTLIAGQYCAIQFNGEPGDVPQTLYCRESLREHFLKMKDFVFEVTKKSMQFFEKFFGVKYQFNKYDSVFVPEFNQEGMKTPACTIMNDLYVFKEEKPATSYTQQALTVANQMAHHWLNDLVKVNWWNDLWLTESFADFISHYCLENIQIQSIKLSNIAVMFNQHKGQGYLEDQMITTHPMADEVINTDVAENIFDGITTSKGASTVKQLMCILGPQKFSEACRQYFQKLGGQKAVLQDLFNHLSSRFKNKNLNFQQWKQQWIEAAGMNEIEPEWNQANRDINSQLVIRQRAALPQLPTLRYHQIKVGFFKEDGGIDYQDVLVKAQEETVVTYDGSKGYKAVLLNYEDQSFVKVLLDQTSTLYFSQNLQSVKDLLTRTLIYRALFDSVRDGKICSEEYVDFLLNQLPNEESDEILILKMQLIQRLQQSNLLYYQIQIQEVFIQKSFCIHC